MKMARKSASAAPSTAQLSPEQIRAALPRLEKRLAELKALDVLALTDENEEVILGDLIRRIDDTLMDIFGSDTQDYHRYSIHTLDDTPIVMGGGWPSVASRRQEIKSAVARAIGKLQSAISILQERIGGSAEDAAARSIRAYAGLDLHKEIARAASKLYQDGHYSNAVEAAVKALNGLVRLRSGLEADGTSLIERALNPTNPIIKFNDLSDQSDRDEQKGFMMMFSGAVSGLRNPRAHGFIKDDPERALEFIAFVSLLAKLLDEAK
jgi:uncharacterized protein (TIGR02391 family)